MQTYYTCTPSFTYDVETAKYASGIWAGDFGQPDRHPARLPGRGWLALRGPAEGISASTPRCGVWCYDGALCRDAARSRTGYACPCPTQQQTDWY